MIKRGYKRNLSLKRRLRSEMTPAENRLKNIAIEVDGDIHAIDPQIAKDKEREKYLAALGVNVIRYMNNDILKNIEGVMEDLFEKTKE